MTLMGRMGLGVVLEIQPYANFEATTRSN